MTLEAFFVMYVFPGFWFLAACDQARRDFDEYGKLRRPITALMAAVYLVYTPLVNEALVMLSVITKVNHTAIALTLGTELCCFYIAYFIIYRWTASRMHTYRNIRYIFVLYGLGVTPYFFMQLFLGL